MMQSKYWLLQLMLLSNEYASISKRLRSADDPKQKINIVLMLDELAEEIQKINGGACIFDLRPFAVQNRAWLQQKSEDED